MDCALTLVAGGRPVKSSRCGALAIDGSSQTVHAGVAFASSKDAKRCNPSRADQEDRRRAAPLGLGSVASAYSMT